MLIDTNIMFVDCNSSCVLLINRCWPTVNTITMLKLFCFMCHASTNIITTTAKYVRQKVNVENLFLFHDLLMLQCHPCVSNEHILSILQLTLQEGAGNCVLAENFVLSGNVLVVHSNGSKFGLLLHDAIGRHDCMIFFRCRVFNHAR